MTLSLSWTKNKHSKYGKSNGNYQTDRATHNLATKYRDVEDTEATIAVSKS